MSRPASKPAIKKLLQIDLLDTLYNRLKKTRIKYLLGREIDIHHIFQTHVEQVTVSAKSLNEIVKMPTIIFFLKFWSDSV